MRYRVAHRRAAAQSGLTQVLGRMSNHFLLIVFLLILTGVLAVAIFKRSLLAKAIAIFLISFPVGTWALLSTYVLAQHGYAPTISRHNTVFLIASNSAYGKTSIFFHLALGLFVLGAGTYFGIRRLREWRNAA